METISAGIEPPPEPRRSHITYALIAAAVAAYVISLQLPAIYYSPDGFPRDPSAHLKIIQSGWDVLIVGFWGVLLGNFAWCANAFGFIALFFALIGYFQKTTLSLAVASFVVGLTANWFNSFPKDESGANNVYVDHLGSAFYVWEASFLLLAISQAKPLFDMFKHAWPLLRPNRG